MQIELTGDELWTLLNVLAEQIDYTTVERYKAELQAIYDKMQAAYEKSGSKAHLKG